MHKAFRGNMDVSAGERAISTPTLSAACAGIIRAAARHPRPRRQAATSRGDDMTSFLLLFHQAVLLLRRAVRRGEMPALRPPSRVGTIGKKGVDERY